MARHTFSVDPQRSQHERTVVELPVRPEEIRELVVILRRQDGTVQVAGPLHEVGRCVQVMREGLAVVMGQKKKGAIEVAQRIPPGMRELVEG